jgi:2-(1,2-epoxy-1,2-dihydrophenyl)acetyl-CoA isomerase
MTTTSEGTTRPQQARALYTSLAAGDRAALEELLSPGFEGTLSPGMPFGIGGHHRGATAMRRDGWGAIARHFRARAEPESLTELADGRVLVTGRYTGHGHSGAELDAPFAHVLTFAGDRISALVQYTDTARWADAAGPGVHSPSALTVDVTAGIATVRLDRPEHHNAIDPAMSRDLREAATRIAQDPSVRVVVLAGNGALFTAGGDLALFAATPGQDLPGLLRRMVDDYHAAVERLTGIDAPVVAAVQGPAAGGGLGLVCAADVAVATPQAVFAVGHGRLGLTADGGLSWFLPRLIGLRRAQEMFLLHRRLTAAEALDWGLLTAVVPADQLDDEVAAIAHRLADGATAAIGAQRRLLRHSFDTGLRDQLAREQATLVQAAGTTDAREGIDAFRHGRPPVFSGRQAMDAPVASTEAGHG